MIRHLLVVLGLLVLVGGCTTERSATEADRSGFTGGTTPPMPYVMPELSLTDTAGRPYNVAGSP